MTKVSVLDASAVLAYLQQERGEDRVEAALDAGLCWITAVNLSEVLGKLCDKGMPFQEAQAAVNDLGLVVVDFDAELAALAASIKTRTKSIGASLGDRACLALAQRAAGGQTAPTVLTAEHAWTKFKWPFKVLVIR
ncbi:MAG: type II toxin-antitoxin system VapC family toxin [Planctomycetaceae bacterium]|nr:type II toxin-antitoxin system VapC family toxin [Planctomycetaceae bacterium]